MRYSGVLVHKDRNCRCCPGWAKHVKVAGLSVKIEAMNNVDVVRSRLGVSTDLTACYTAELRGYIVEGRMPASPEKRLLQERPDAVGIAVAVLWGA